MLSHRRDASCALSDGFRWKGRKMATLMLTVQERLTLLDLIECAVSDLRTEIVRTGSHDLKDQLKEKKQLLIELQGKLKTLEPTALKC